jgi:predicted PurR-regulated permease PerM
MTICSIEHPCWQNKTASRVAGTLIVGGVLAFVGSGAVFFHDESHDFPNPLNRVDGIVASVLLVMGISLVGSGSCILYRIRNAVQKALQQQLDDESQRLTSETDDLQKQLTNAQLRADALQQQGATSQQQLDAVEQRLNNAQRLVVTLADQNDKFISECTKNYGSVRN